MDAAAKPHGWVYGVYRNRIHPAIPKEASFCFCCCCCCSSGLQQVQGRRPCRTPYLPITLAIASTSSSPVTGLRRKPPMPAASTCCCRSGSVRAVTASNGSM